MKPLCLVALAFLVPSFTCYCQDIFTLSGKVTDAEKQPLNSGDIFILKESDSTVIKKADILKGAFAFEPLIRGEYLLKITSSGYKDKIQLLILDETKSVVISMEHSTAMLDQVLVTADKRTFINKNGNTLINVENSPLASIPDAINLVSKLPSVQVSPDGESISVVGKGTPLIYIDGQKMTMEDLKSLSVSDIKTIELINDPSTKYEADGRTVLSITRKSNRKEGWKAELGETAAYRKYYLNRSFVNVSVRKKKLELKANLQYNQLKTWEGNAFDFTIPSRHIESRYSVTAVTTRPQFVGEAGAFYQINEKNYISLSVNSRTQRESFPIYTSSLLKDATHEENVFTSAFNRTPNLYYTSKLNYNKSIKNGFLFVGAQQTGYVSKVNADIFNTYDNTSELLSQSRKQKTNIGVIAMRVDFEKTFGKGVKWEAGGTATDAGSHGFSDITSYDPNNVLNATFNYSEKNYAGYTQLSATVRKISYSAGLRVENTNVVSNYDDKISPTAIHKSATQLFPKASAKVSLDSSKSVTLRYSRTIQRPDYSNANQAAVYINPYFEWTNNINLDPSITDEVAASFQFHDYSLAMSIYRTRGPVYSSFIYNDSDAILRRSEVNYDNEVGSQLSLTIPFKYKIWSSTNMMTTMLSTIRDLRSAAGKTRPFAYFYSSNDFALPGKFKFTVSGWAITKRYQGAFEKSALFQVDTSLTKTLFRNLNCTVRFNDMFRSLNNNGEKFTVNAVAANGEYRDNVREFAVALRYSIGKLKESRYQNKDVDESGSRVR